MKTLGAVLVGGASTRFGSDKSLARIGNTTMLQVIHETLLAAGLDSFAYVGGRAREGFDLSFRHVPDEIADVDDGEQSSLRGVLAALTHAWTTGLEAVVILGCDVPLVTTNTIQRLVSALDVSDVSVAECDGDHWSILAARVDIREHVLAQYLAGRRAIHRALTDLRISRVACTTTECTNVNDVATLQLITENRSSDV